MYQFSISFVGYFFHASWRRRRFFQAVFLCIVCRAPWRKTKCFCMPVCLCYPCLFVCIIACLSICLHVSISVYLHLCTLYFTSSFTQTVLFGDHVKFLQYVQYTYIHVLCECTILVSGAAKTAGNLSCIACQEGLKLGITLF